MGMMKSMLYRRMRTYQSHAPSKYHDIKINDADVCFAIDVDKLSTSARSDPHTARRIHVLMTQLCMALCACRQISLQPRANLMVDTGLIIS
jgi:hypothetical protein